MNISPDRYRLLGRREDSDKIEQIQFAGNIL